MASNWSLKMIDYDGEGSSFSLTGVDTSAANYDAQITLIGALRTAVEGVTLGNTGSISLTAFNSKISDAPAGSAFAQREIKWLVTIAGDTTGNLYQREIPTADLALLAPNSNEMATGAARTALVTAIEDYFRGQGNETGTVVSIKHVGRNN